MKKKKDIFEGWDDMEFDDSITNDDMVTKTQMEIYAEEGDWTRGAIEQISKEINKDIIEKLFKLGTYNERN